ncbi:MAG: hypothetical protein ACHQAX_06790 [Gammaproteobacteria bacterium]
MPYHIPDLTIDLETCLAGADETTKKQFEALIVLFNALKDIPENKCEQYYYKKSIEQEQFNFYLVGGRASFLVLNALHHQGKLKGPFWDKFNWVAFENRLADNNDFDTQFAFDQPNRIMFPNDIHLGPFITSASSAIGGPPPETKGADNKHISCSNKIIDVAIQLKSIDTIDITNTSFRINLLTGKVSCFSQEGFELLINKNIVDMPKLIDYMIPSERKKRADYSKILFMLRNFEKFISAGFILSEKNQLWLETKINMNYGLFKQYAEKKINKLKREHGEDKLFHFENILGKSPTSWMLNLASLSLKNEESRTQAMMLSSKKTISEEDIPSIQSKLTEHSDLPNEHTKCTDKSKPLSSPPSPSTATHYPCTYQLPHARKEKKRGKEENEITPLDINILLLEIKRNDMKYVTAFRMRSLHINPPAELSTIIYHLDQDKSIPLANPRQAISYGISIFLICLMMAYFLSTSNDREHDLHDASATLRMLGIIFGSVCIGGYAYQRALFPSWESAAQMGLDNNLDELRTVLLDKKSTSLDLRLPLALTIYYGSQLEALTKNKEVIKKIIHKILTKKFENQTNGVFSLIDIVYKLHTLPRAKLSYICDTVDALVSFDKNDILTILEKNDFYFNRHTKPDEMKASFMDSLITKPTERKTP